MVLQTRIFFSGSRKVGLYYKPPFFSLQNHFPKTAFLEKWLQIKWLCVYQECMQAEDVITIKCENLELMAHYENFAKRPNNSLIFRCQTKFCSEHVRDLRQS